MLHNYKGEIRCPDLITGQMRVYLEFKHITNFSTRESDPKQQKFKQASTSKIIPQQYFPY